MKQKKELQILKLLRLGQLFFVLLTWLFAILVIIHKIDRAIWAIIFMVISLVLGYLYQQKKKMLIKKGVKIK